MIQARFIIEAQGKPKSFVENTLKQHIEKIKMMKDIKVADTKWEETEEINEQYFSALADVGISAPNFETFFAALMGAAPTAVVVEKPEKMSVELRELQNVSNDLVQMFHLFAQANAEMRMANKELQQKFKATGMRVDVPMNTESEE
ncbi:MAG: hypothetical protein GOV01_03030 [Candidatus Altiarchaeota archaeon]|nr:hypothetical protein [Candidatus Altiarchaeota archaeon]